SSQYCDMIGTAAIDWGEVPEFGDFLAKHGIDTENFLPIGINVYAGENFESVSVYAIEKSELGCDDVDGMIEYAREHNDTLPVTKFDLDCSFNDLLKATKLFNLVALRSWTDEVSIDVQNE